MRPLSAAVTTATIMLVASLAARDAVAQTAAPRLELGLDATSLLDPDRSGLARGPRLVVNFDGRNALQVTTSFQALSPSEPFVSRENDLYLAAFKRVVHANGPLRVFTTLGGGLSRTVVAARETSFPGPPPRAMSA